MGWIESTQLTPADTTFKMVFTIRIKKYLQMKKIPQKVLLQELDIQCPSSITFEEIDREVTWLTNMDDTKHMYLNPWIELKGTKPFTYKRSTSVISKRLIEWYHAISHLDRDAIYQSSSDKVLKKYYTTHSSTVIYYVIYLLLLESLLFAYMTYQQPVYLIWFIGFSILLLLIYYYF